MSLRVKDICSIMEKAAPKRLSENYDNVGLMVGNLDSDISSILVSLDCTLNVIDEAKRKNCNFIFTHHPLLFKKPSSITTETLLGSKIIKLIKNDISLYSSHTNLDSVQGGLNDILVKILGFSNSVVIEQSTASGFNDGNSGIGRIVRLNKKITLAELCKIVKEKLNLTSITYIGKEDKLIEKVALINGSGSDYMDMSRGMGADCIITGDVTYHYASDYNEMGIAVIDAGHFGTEWPALKEVASNLKNKINKLGYNNSVLLSESTRDPYKTK
ncbi:Nif3-like dinuclear metal center hexameric protein [Clostridium arbusti]|uniref:Nif3-like dinuclear metal center hexameric protein n=1 Tax=Clostridium arbusti TaxID=1137848 RepID=UPI000289ABA5|nr:Nif3-like dinuclear metal center hexameric protein [Clostridium arbusti]